MRKVALALCLAVSARLALAVGPCVTDEMAGKLERQFRPAKLMEEFMLEIEGFDRAFPTEESIRTEHHLPPDEQLKEHGPDMLFQRFIAYNELSFPGDPRTYVMLLWRGSAFGTTFWRLLASEDCQNFTLVQENQVPIYVGANLWGVRTQDLDADGIPEVLVQSGVIVDHLYVYRWKGRNAADGPLEMISPCIERWLKEDRNCYSELSETAFGTSIEDLDGDGKAEIVVSPKGWREEFTTKWGTRSARWHIEKGTRIYRLVDGRYQLYRELAEDEPVVATALAVFHPGTLSWEELSAPGQGELRVFVSHPAGTSLSVDDFDPGSFVLDVGKVPLVFAKRWENKSFPDLSQGNTQFDGVPVRKQKVAKRGEWEVNPAQPSYPLDEAWEFVFLGPYLEFRLPRAAAFPLLKAKADAKLAQDPQATRVWVELPVRAKLRDGMPAALSVGVWVKKAGKRT